MTDGNRSRARTWAAMLLTLVGPGLGHALYGQARRGFAFLGLACGVLVLMPAALLLIPFAPLNVVLAFALAAAFFGVCLADTWRTARRGLHTRPVPLRIAAHVAGLIGLLALSALLRQYVVASWRVPSSSMAPTLLQGDHFLSESLRYRLHPPERGDLVILRHPRTRAAVVVKRVIGIPGDEVWLEAEGVVLNGEPQVESFARYDGGPGCRMGLDRPVSVPADALFVLGDNRCNSEDSRFWGAVPIDRVIGRARVIYWSVERPSADGGSRPSSALFDSRPRWDRIGRRLN